MNIYLISAASYHLINKEVNKIYKDKQYITINYANSDINEIIYEANNLSFFDNEKYIVVNNANFFGKDKLDDKYNKMLITYLENPNPKTKIIFTMLDQLDKRKKVVKLIAEKYKLIEIPIWDKIETKEEIKKYINSFNYEIDNDSISYIYDNNSNNLDILFNSLDNIMMYYNKPCHIKFEDVKAIVGREVDNNSWHFINSVINKNLKESVRILNNLKVYKVDSISLITLLAREYRLLYLVKNMKKFKLNINFFEQFYNLRDWQINNIYNNSFKYKDRELLDNLLLLGVYDYKIKSGIYDKDTALVSILLQVCI